MTGYPVLGASDAAETGMADPTACVLCGSDNVFQVQTIETDTLIAAWRRDLVISVSDCFIGVRQIQLMECRDCCVQYFTPVTAAGTGDLYEQLAKFGWYYMPRKWEHVVAMEDLRGCRRIIEIGCGSGEFIAHASSVAHLVVEGIELSPYAVERAQRQGLPVRLLDLGDLVQNSAGQYDAVCSFQVLEHVANPRQFLLDVCCLLKPGGRLILGLPNGDSFLKRQFNILDMPPHHMTRWPTKSIERLPASFPLQAMHLRFEPLAEYHVDGYVGANLQIPEDASPVWRLARLATNRLLAGFLKVTRLRKALRGQSLYATFLRT